MVSNKKKNEETIIQLLIQLEQEELLDSGVIAKILGYENFDNYDEVGVYTKGYRILNKIPRMPSNIVENLIKTFKSFQHILLADIPELDNVEGIGEIRARTIKQSLQRMQEQFVFERIILQNKQKRCQDLKNEKGITLLTLIITVIVMVLLTGTAIAYGTNSLQTMKFQNFRFELEQIQGKVDVIYEKLQNGQEYYTTTSGVEKYYNTLGQYINTSSAALNRLQDIKGNSVSTTNYRYFSRQDLERDLDITSDPGDVIINFHTREVISVNGFTFEGTNYYRLEDIK